MPFVSWDSAGLHRAWRPPFERREIGVVGALPKRGDDLFGDFGHDMDGAVPKSVNLSAGMAKGPGCVDRCVPEWARGRCGVSVAGEDGSGEMGVVEFAGEASVAAACNLPFQFSAGRPAGWLRSSSGLEHGKKGKDCRVGRTFGIHGGARREDWKAPAGTIAAGDDVSLVASEAWLGFAGGRGGLRRALRRRRRRRKRDKKDFHGALPRTPDNHVECGRYCTTQGRAGGCLRLKKPGHSPVESAPGRIRRRDAQTVSLLGREIAAAEVDGRGLAVSDGHGRFEPAEEAGA